MLEGGEHGHQRLSLQHEALRTRSVWLLRAAGLTDGDSGLDLGCGGGHTTFELAEIVGPRGHVTGIDADLEIVRLARIGAEERGYTNVSFETGDVRGYSGERVDFAYARLLLSHLADPGEMISRMIGYVKPGGKVAIEDLDVSAIFSEPEDDSANRLVEIYSAGVRHGGGDPLLARRLPVLAVAAGLKEVQCRFYQPAYLDGPFKHLGALTLQRMRQTLIDNGVASVADVDAAVADLHAFADRPGTLATLPRFAQVWGTT